MKTKNLFPNLCNTSLKENRDALECSDFMEGNWEISVVGSNATGQINQLHRKRSLRCTKVLTQVNACVFARERKYIVFTLMKYDC